MARLARVVVPGLPHHVTQRGNRRQQVFFEDADYRAYRDLLAEYCAKAETTVWAYCLMPNHVHLILVPSHPDGLRAALGEAHRRYSRRINRRQDWQGHLWQERFHSFPMDETWLLACARYVEQNPVRAGLVQEPQAWPWSSARAHLAGGDDDLVSVAALGRLVPDWPGFLGSALNDKTLDHLRRHGRTGRPAGAEHFVEGLEHQLGRTLKPRPAGRPKKQPAVAAAM